MLVLRTSYFQGETIRPIVPKHKHSIVFIVHHFTQFKLFIVLYACLFIENFSWTTTRYPGIFVGRALWADSVSLRMNTIATRDQFKQIRIGENLAVSYNA